MPLTQKCTKFQKERLGENHQDNLDKAIAKFKSNRYTVLIEKVSFINHIKNIHGEDQHMIEDLAIHMKYRKN